MHGGKSRGAPKEQPQRMEARPLLRKSIELRMPSADYCQNAAELVERC